jgi:hypothetical protein
MPDARIAKQPMIATEAAKRIESRNMCVIAPVGALAGADRGGVEDNEQPLYWASVYPNRNFGCRA